MNALEAIREVAQRTRNARKMVAMSNVAYPKPATPLPWNALQEPDEIFGQDGSRAAVADGANSRAADSNAAYLVRAANAFPHLVAALEMVHTHKPAIATLTAVARALRIARGDVKP